MKRQLKSFIAGDLQKKMVFISGPRQVGKTWLAKNIAADYKDPLYLNYDSFEDRQIIEAKSWIDIARSLKKEYKVYFFDTGLVKGDEGVKFENFVAISLQKHLTFLEDIKGVTTRLHYLKTKEKQEVDFALIIDDKVDTIIEVKTKKDDIPKALLYYKEKYDFKSILLLKETQRQRSVNGVEIRIAHKYLAQLEA